MKRKFIFLTFILTLLLCISGCEDSPISEHECSFTEYARTESSCTEHGKVYLRCYCGERTEERLKLAEHTPKNVSGKAATCSEAGYTDHTVCSVCLKILSGFEEIGIMNHNIVIDSAIPPTDGKPGKSEGSHCSLCDMVIVPQTVVYADAYSTPESYDGDYAYRYLATLQSGAALTELYWRIDEVADAFHTSAETVSGDFVVAPVDYADLGLSSEQALAVWSAYRIDRPLYYWISNNVTYSTSFINIIAVEDYADGAVREGLNSDIYETVEHYVTAANADDAYGLSLAFHDMIIESAYYAYEADGETPSAEVWAHNVIGVLLEGRGVCESYTEAFQLLLNYCGVGNIVVTGYAGEPHAWNLVEIEDGQWYWFDLTWDDSPDFMWGVLYTNFCVTDNQNTGWRDGAWSVSASTFITSHVPEPVQNTGIDFMYSLPDRAAQVYDGYLRDTFTVAGLTFAISGHGEVALTSIDRRGAVVIPETVDYQGKRYTVNIIGRIEDGLFKNGAISESAVTSIHIPASVEYIFDAAFSIDTLTSLTVDPDNPFYSYHSGMLYDKDKTYIYALIDRSITSLYIDKDVRGWSNNGTVFYNCLALSAVSVHPDNPYFEEYGGILYNETLTEIVMIPRAISGIVTLADTLVSLGSDDSNATFSYRSKLSAVIVPTSVSTISETFYNCASFTHVFYLGTSAQWRALTGGGRYPVSVLFYSPSYIQSGWYYVGKTPTPW